jgi:hypothetical protein
LNQEVWTRGREKEMTYTGFDGQKYMIIWADGKSRDALFGDGRTRG